MTKPKPQSFLLRIAPDLLEDLKALAEEETRSVNKQIEFILRQYLEERTQSATGNQDD